MKRLKEKINEKVSCYKQELIENPFERIVSSIPWVFIIIIGLMAVFAYIKFIVDGGYSMAVARIKENGPFASANFTYGTIGIISNKVVWIIIGIIMGIMLLAAIFFMYEEKEILQSIFFTIDLIVMAFCFVCLIVKIEHDELLNQDIDIIYSLVILAAIVIFFKLLIDSYGGGILLLGMIGIGIYLIILALLLFLENIVAIGAFAGALILVGITAAVIIFSNSSGESSGGTYSAAGSSTSLNSVSGNSGVKSRKSGKKTDDIPAYKKDSNPNHHYIATYNEVLGVKLYKVHDKMGDYIELDNTRVEKKICSLADAESGKHRFYREESGKEIRVQEIPWK